MSLSDMDKIIIVLHEYDSLRSEIVQRSGFMYQMLEISFAITLLIAISIVLSDKNYKSIFNFSPKSLTNWLLSLLALGLFAMALFGFYRDIEKSAARIREIESYVNQLAGENLLKWETQWGGSQTGYWGLARKLPDPTARPAQQ